MPKRTSAVRAQQVAVPSPTRCITKLHSRAEDGGGVSPADPKTAAASLAETPDVLMAAFLQAQEATLERFGKMCAVTSDHPETAALTGRYGTSNGLSHPISVEVSSNGATHSTLASQRVVTAPHLSSMNDNSNLSSSASTQSRASLQHRVCIIAELLQRNKESQWATTVGRAALREHESLQRAVTLEEGRLALARRKNAALRARLAAATRERQEAAKLPPQPRGDGGTALVETGARQSTSLALLPAASATANDYTNEIVEARRQLDQRTRELQTCQERLHQLQQCHLDQLSGKIRPMLFAEDALRTTENFLDAETNMAVRATVVDALLEVNEALKPLAANGREGSTSTAALPCLENISTLWDRLAVQNFVVGRINRLFTCMCPTAPPLTLLKDTNMM